MGEKYDVETKWDLSHTSESWHNNSGSRSCSDVS